MSPPRDFRKITTLGLGRLQKPPALPVHPKRSLSPVSHHDPQTLDELAREIQLASSAPIKSSNAVKAVMPLSQVLNVDSVLYKELLLEKQHAFKIPAPRKIHGLKLHPSSKSIQDSKKLNFIKLNEKERELLRLETEMKRKHLMQLKKEAIQLKKVSEEKKKAKLEALDEYRKRQRMALEMKKEALAKKKFLNMLPELLSTDQDEAMMEIEPEAAENPENSVIIVDARKIEVDPKTNLSSRRVSDIHVALDKQELMDASDSKRIATEDPISSLMQEPSQQGDKPRTISPTKLVAKENNSDKLIEKSNKPPLPHQMPSPAKQEPENTSLISKLELAKSFMTENDSSFELCSSIKADMLTEATQPELTAQQLILQKLTTQLLNYGKRLMDLNHTDSSSLDSSSLDTTTMPESSLKPHLIEIQFDSNVIPKDDESVDKAILEELDLLTDQIGIGSIQTHTAKLINQDSQMEDVATNPNDSQSDHMLMETIEDRITQSFFLKIANRKEESSLQMSEKTKGNDSLPKWVDVTDKSDYRPIPMEPAQKDEFSFMNVFKKKYKGEKKRLSPERNGIQSNNIAEYGSSSQSLKKDGKSNSPPRKNRSLKKTNEISKTQPDEIEVFYQPVATGKKHAKTVVPLVDSDTSSLRISQSPFEYPSNISQISVPVRDLDATESDVSSYRHQYSRSDFEIKPEVAVEPAAYKKDANEEPMSAQPHPLTKEYLMNPSTRVSPSTLHKMYVNLG